MQTRISPARRVRGVVRLPGDKSISHRAGMLSAVADGDTTIHNYATGADCAATLGCMQAMGVNITRAGSELTVRGAGLTGLRASAGPLDAGNSGSTIRMLSGILAAQPFRCSLIGDESLSQRPMARVMTPLREMGARIDGRDGKYPPIDIEGGPLRAIDYTPPIPSAQVKSCVLFAGVFADGETIVRESVRTRDHSESILREFGADIDARPGSVKIRGGVPLKGRDFTVPGDISSSTFFLVAASLLPASDISIEGVGLNPTRTAVLDYLKTIGADIQVTKIERVSGELVGDLRVRHAKTGHGVIEGALTASLIDEIPALAILGAAAGGLVVRDAAELRVKETDRIATIAENLKRMGVRIDVQPDGFAVEGGQRFEAAQVDSFGDHRIAMAFAVAALAATGECIIDDARAASVSFPEFYEYLAALTA